MTTSTDAPTWNRPARFRPPVEPLVGCLDVDALVRLSVGYPAENLLERNQ